MSALAPPAAADRAGATRPETVIAPSRGFIGLRPRELWEHRELCLLFAWRDIKVRYKQTALGGLWAVLQPLALMVVFTVFLHHLAHVSARGAPYPLFTFAALVPWTMFASGLASAADSLVSNSPLVSKVYFPRLLIPLGAVLAPAVDFAIAFALLIALTFAYGVVPPAAIVAVPGFFLLGFACTLASGLWLAALNVRYRDFRYTVALLVQLLLFATPVAYASSALPHALRFAYALNPMAAVVNGFRWAVIGAGGPPGASLAVSVGVVALLLVGGLAYFKRVERTFADVI
jgi:lipopolysaccharide transport system permease protein